MDIDTSQARRLSQDLGRVPGRVVPAARAVVMKAAINIKEETRANVSGHPAWRRIASTVSYDMSGLSAEVGYEDRGQGELAGIYEFGSARRAPHPTLIPASQAEEPRFIAALDKAIRALL